MLSQRNKFIIIAYDKGYYIDNGNIVSPSGKILKGTINDHGYLCFSIKHKFEKCTISVHRLCAFQQFGKQIFFKDIQVRHLDGNPLNNTEDNIDIGTCSQNHMDKPSDLRIKYAKHAAKSLRKFKNKDIKQIRLLKQHGKSLGHISKLYNTSKGHISDIVNKKIYKDI